jgi:hypothetical protein
MKKIYLALLTILASFSFIGTASALNVNPPAAVPETGSTLILLAVGFGVVGLVNRKLTGRKRAKDS